MGRRRVQLEMDATTALQVCGGGGAGGLHVPRHPRPTPGGRAHAGDHLRRVPGVWYGGGPPRPELPGPGDGDGRERPSRGAPRGVPLPRRGRDAQVHGRRPGHGQCCRRRGDKAAETAGGRVVGDGDGAAAHDEHG
uniref:Uncharacterized protein n=1 Tax=Arundo donax TaxID=35708 RepID=A0A0A9DJ81_ARUDO